MPTLFVSMSYARSRLLSFEDFLAKYRDNPCYEQQQYCRGELTISGILPNLQLRLDDILPR